MVSTLLLDNEAAFELTQNPEFHKRIKHIHTRHFFVKALDLEKETGTKKISTENQ